MSNITVAFLAYLIDRIFGEFQFITHPIITIGQLISWFEKHYYKSSVARGVLLLLFTTLTTVTATCLLTHMLSLLPSLLETLVTAVIASMFLAHKMLYDAVLEVISSDTPREKLRMLVSRDTQELSESEINKACIETYAENLSDGVIAPLLFLLLFGLPGMLFYKSVNTLDSMVGYRTPHYEKYGKASALLDDLLNYIPSRLTALLIMFITQTRPFLSFYAQGKKHDSPNAGHPISAMALALKIKLGGDTSYFGQIKQKAWFGRGKKNILKEDVKAALALRHKIDIVVLATLALLSLLG